MRPAPEPLRCVVRSASGGGVHVRHVADVPPLRYIVREQERGAVVLEGAEAGQRFPGQLAHPNG